MGYQRFKVGDWVRVKDNCGAPLDYKIGDICQVSAVRKDLVYCGDAAMFAKRFEPWQPRVGERVRFTDKVPSFWFFGPAKEYKDGVIKSLNSEGYRFCVKTGDAVGCVSIEHIEPILTAAAPDKPATLKIEAGRFYKTRDGRKVGPMVRWSYSVEHPWEQQGGSSVFTKGGDIWRDDGTSEYDVPPLVAEWIDEPVAKPSNDNAKPKFKVGDRVEYTVGCGLATVSAVRSDGKYLVNWDDGQIGDVWWDDDDFDAVDVRPTTAIVALIENGQPKPSSTPHVHASTGAAEKEAKRLAAKYKGKQFGVFTLTATHEEAAPVYDHKWQNMAALGLKIDAIKELRAVAGLTLKGAKEAVEAWIEYEQAA